MHRYRWRLAPILGPYSTIFKLLGLNDKESEFSQNSTFWLRRHCTIWFFFYLKMHPNNWRLGSTLDPSRGARHVLHTIGDDGVKDGAASNLSFLATPLVNLHRTKSFLFDLKCSKIDGGWGSAPDPFGSLQRSHRPPAVRRGAVRRGWEVEVEGREWGSLRFCDFAPLPQLPGYVTAT